jgi:16S rRNA (cytosine1402-N4)-methyltransferase
MDEKAIERAERIIKKKKIKNIILENDNFGNIQKIYDKNWKDKISGLAGIVFDLGLSSDQLKDADRGFSFNADAPLNMAFGQKTEGKSTEDLVNYGREEELARILKEYGEERFANRIAKGIVAERRIKRIETTGSLVEAVRKSTPSFYRNNKKIHFATKTFMALRIATNDEFENLRKALPAAFGLLKPGGRIAVVSFHSLEDRIVKNFFRDESRDCLCPPELPACVCGHTAGLKILTKKPIAPSLEEVKDNPRARSAKLRAAEKIK